MLTSLHVFFVAASQKMQRLLQDRMTSGVAKLKDRLSTSRKITICLDGWTKKGLSSSYLGISACFFDTVSDKPMHALLNLDQIQHPHSGEKLCKCVQECLEKWEIPTERVIQVVSDNGSNMVKAIRLLREEAQKAAKQTNLQRENDETDMLINQFGFTTGHSTKSLYIMY